ncbi:uncharacterized protein LOC127148919 [Cucumis melo]|uniref:Uncharacterized protein LOC127148919 n=2 Tax=Cucumis melo TaxID=3656 RepID=A0ABM3KNE0_CUCME|nr:uncharacterized protein LOC127148919 [Cucumis melo]
MQVSSAKNKNPVIGDMSFYGMIKEIWEVSYNMFNIVIYKCNWVENKTGVQKDDLHFTLVDLSRIGDSSNSFINTTHGKQVFYVSNPVDARGSVVVMPPQKDFPYKYANDDLGDMLLHYPPSRQKSYADVRRKDLEFEVGDMVFLKVAPMKGVLRFAKKGKLSPRFVGPFEILERIGPVAYRLALPPSLAAVHDVFHISMLRKYVADPTHVVDFEPLQFSENLSYEEQPVEVLAREVKKLRSREIPLVKILWQNHGVEEATWEKEEDMRAQYPELFED